MTFREKVKERLKKEGRRMDWLANQIPMNRKTLWLKMKEKKLTSDEKSKICFILKMK